MIPRFVVPLVLVGLATISSRADDPKPATVDEVKSALKVDDPTSVLGVKARDSFSRAKQALDDKYKTELGKVYDSLVTDLTKARAVALEKNDLDEAQRIVASIKGIEEERKTLAAKESPRFEVLKAYWGANDQWFEVTDTLQALVNRGRLEIPGEKLLPMLPYKLEGIHKTLLVVYRVNGRLLVETSYRTPHLSLPKKADFKAR